MNDFVIDKNIVDVWPDPLIAIDGACNVLWWNNAAEKLLHVDEDRHKQQSIEQLLPVVGIKDFCLSKHGDPLEVQLADHLSSRVEISVFDYQLEQRLLRLRDMTHLHHLEQMRQDFVANVSHELRTPLTVIHGYLASLLDYSEDLSDRHKDILQKIYQQSERMHKLIEDLLLLARLESHTQDANSDQIASIPALLHRICDDAKVLSHQRAHQFHLAIDESLDLYGQEKELQGAFSNLIFNAVHYTPAKEHIYIDWYADATGAHFVVRDTGLGIDAEHIPRLTERFYRVDKARSRDSGGTGLGLAIVKHVLIRHDAELSIESLAGKGTTFSCHFPLRSVVV